VKQNKIYFISFSEGDAVLQRSRVIMAVAENKKTIKEIFNDSLVITYPKPRNRPARLFPWAFLLLSTEYLTNKKLTDSF
jgi:hypothetical protein